MKSQEEEEKNKKLDQIKKLPDSPGVYFFCDRKGKILYVGKATSLRDRVRSYFNPDIVLTRSPLVSKMLEDFSNIKHIKTDSVLEALVLEANLIKKYQPAANIKEKDNKSFNFVVISRDTFPVISVMRGRELLQNVSTFQVSPRSDLGGNNLRKPTNRYHTIYRMISKNQEENTKNTNNIAYSFGPFPNGSQLREALKIVRRMFPYRDEKCTPRNKQKNPEKPRACFNRQIGLCPGVCTGEISQEDYIKQVKNIILFFEGNKKRLLKNLEKQMKYLARERKFEEAAKIKKTIFTLNHIQDISLIKDDMSRGILDTLSGGARREIEGIGNVGREFRIESYDIAHTSGQDMVGVMTVVEDGEIKKSDYKRFKIKEITGSNDTGALTEILSRRLGHIEWRFPDLIVVDGGKAQKNAFERVLKKQLLQIPVVSVVKDEYHRPREILGDKKWLQYEREIILSNIEAHRFGLSYHKKLRDKIN